MACNDSTSVVIHVMDPPASDKPATWVRKAHIILLCFDMQTYESMRPCSEFFEKHIEKACRPDCQIALVACKNDFPTRCEKSAATSWCDLAGAKLRRRVLYFTTSAKNDHGEIDSLFQRVLAEYVVADIQTRKANGEEEPKKNLQHHHNNHCIVN